MPAIDIENLSFSYGDKQALKDVSIVVEEGDFTGLIGPNGSGKTTLIKNILGFIESEKGEIEIFGEKAMDFSDWNLIGYIPQHFEEDKQFPGTVRELLEANRSITGSTENIESLDIDSFLDSKFKDLSGGQKQRAMLALALQKNPDILILDEPSLGVDVEAQENFYNLIKELNDQGTTIILVTHDIGVVSEHTDKVICINNSVCCQGKTENLSKHVEEVYGDNYRLFHHMHEH
jgi:zinc transport system ATP-binding protein